MHASLAVAALAGLWAQAPASPSSGTERGGPCDTKSGPACPAGSSCAPSSAHTTAGHCILSYPGIKHVHVVNSCHLDIGFANSSLGIVNEYFDHHIPMAASVGRELRAAGGGSSALQHFTDSKLNFMFQSWIIDLYLDCPTGMGLHCPSAAQASAVRAAIAANDITWQAYPHDAQLEVIAPALIKAGLLHTFALDKQFNLPRKTTLSQRDVPGASIHISYDSQCINRWLWYFSLLTD